MVHWLSLLPYSKRVLFLNLPASCGPSVCSLHILPVLVWVLFECFGFLSHTKNMQVRLIDDSKLPVGVNVCVNTLSMGLTGDLYRVYVSSHPVSFCSVCNTLCNLLLNGKTAPVTICLMCYTLG